MAGPTSASVRLMFIIRVKTRSLALTVLFLPFTSLSATRGVVAWPQRPHGNGGFEAAGRRV
jgi:hypothetical protein